MGSLACGEDDCCPPSASPMSLCGGRRQRRGGVLKNVGLEDPNVLLEQTGKLPEKPRKDGTSNTESHPRGQFHRQPI